MGIIRILIAVVFVILAACSDSTEPVEVTRVAVNIPTPQFTITPDKPVEPPTPTIAITPICDCAAPPDPRVTFEGYLLADIPTLDPQLATDKVSQNYVENLFVQLTNFELSTNEIVPEAATSWEISKDGRLYTFHLRTDINWVYHNPINDKTLQAVDKEGTPRFVNAHDFTYGIRRLCDPRINSDYGRVVGPLIVGCESVLNADNPEEISQALLDLIGVQAVDEATLTIELNAPASHFLSMTPMGPLSAVPSWTIEEYGEEWIEAGNIVTNGRYVLNEWVHMVWNTLLRNPLIPPDMRGTGNIEVYQSWIVPNIEVGYGLWQNNVVDVSLIPAENLGTHLANFSDQTFRHPDSNLHYIGYRMSKEPFDNVHVRRAFSAAIDRKMLIDNFQQIQDLLLTNLTLPGMIAGPSIDEIGVGFDPTFARAELVKAGYPNCEGLPPVSILSSMDSIFTYEMMAFAKTQWQTHVGCSPDLFSTRQQTQIGFETLLSPTGRDDVAPNLWFDSWGADYADENNMFSDFLSCTSLNNYQKRPCNEIDTYFVEASQEIDPNRRSELYIQLEEALFGPDGEHPIIPLWNSIRLQAIKPWLDYTPNIFGGDQWYNDSIDKEAKDAAQS